MNELEILKRGIEPLITELENMRYEIISLIEQNIIKGISAVKPIALLVQVQIVNLTTFLKQMVKLIK